MRAGALGKAWGVLRETGREFFEDKCLNHAAALSYYTIFSIAPVLIIVIAVTSLFFGNERVTAEIYKQASGLIGEQGGASIRQMVENSYRPSQSLWATLVGVATLLVGATSVFTHIQDALNSLWGVKPKPRRNLIKLLRDRLLSFGMIIGVGFLLLVSLVLNAALAALGRYMQESFPQIAVHLLQGVETVVSLGVSAFLFAMIFKFLPDAKIGWRDVRAGAFMTALLFGVGKHLIGLYLGSTGVASAYGAAGALIILILWVNYSSLILFFGAEFTQVYAKMYGSRIVPADYAVRIVRVEQEVEKDAPTEGKLINQK